MRSSGFPGSVTGLTSGCVSKEFIQEDSINLPNNQGHLTPCRLATLGDKPRSANYLLTLQPALLARGTPATARRGFFYSQGTVMYSTSKLSFIPIKLLVRLILSLLVIIWCFIRLSIVLWCLTGDAIYMSHRTCSCNPIIIVTNARVSSWTYLISRYRERSRYFVTSYDVTLKV